MSLVNSEDMGSTTCGTPSSMELVLAIRGKEKIVLSGIPVYPSQRLLARGPHSPQSEPSELASLLPGSAEEPP